MQHHNFSGWLFSIDADEQDGAVLWFVGEDGSRLRLAASIISTFYIGGRQESLGEVAAHLGRSSAPLRTFTTERQDLYEGPRKVLAVQTSSPVFQQRLVADLKRRCAALKLDFFDAGIPLSVRFAAERGVFPTGRCFVSHDGRGNLLEIFPRDDPWQIDAPLPEWRILTVEPDVNPQQGTPAAMHLAFAGAQRTLPMDQPLQVLRDFSSLLEDFDPDILVAFGGDAWLFPALLGWAQQHHFPFNPGREPRRPYLLRDEVTFQSYGVVHFRAKQTFLFGRAHLDPGNVTTGGFSLDSTIELSRVTALPIQVAARNSPGAGFTAMQIAEALRRGVLVPEHKFQTERFKSVAELNLADNGGLNYRPVVGLHDHVAALDYFSMYASIMVRMNISGETVGVKGRENILIPETGVPISQDQPGLVPSVLRPLLAKRLAVKRLMAGMSPDDPRRERLHRIADALKWLGYVSFGYQGFKHNLYGNIQAHEAITAFGREMLVRAVEAAHDQGFTVLAANTDSLFVRRPGCILPAHFQPLIDEICRRTGLVIMPEAMFDWIVFLPSKGNPSIGATNRYFGRLQGGGSKVRGLSQRRYDTPAWVVEGEKEIISLLVSQPDARRLAALLPRATALMRQKMDDLYRGRVPPSDLVITRRLSRELDAFKGAAESALVARQFLARDRAVRVGQKLEYIYIRGRKPGVLAVDHVHWPEDCMLDKPHYCALLARAAYQLLSPLGVREQDMPALAGEGLRQLPLFGG